MMRLVRRENSPPTDVMEYYGDEESRESYKDELRRRSWDR